MKSRSTLLVVVFYLAGCTRLGFGSDPPGDAFPTTDQAAVDGQLPAADGAADGQLPAADSTAADGPAPDAWLDGPSSPPDASQTDGLPCSPTKDINPGASQCSKQCLSTAGDPDCDGLPGSLDPKPTSCNKLLFLDDLATAASSGGTWNVKGSTKWSCGVSNFIGGAELELANLSSMPNGRHLIQIKFKLGTVQSGSWLVQIESGSNGIRYTCEMRVTSTAPSSPELHLMRGNGTTPCGSTSISSPPTLNGSVGKVYYLQTYHDGSGQTCRILDDSGPVVQTLNLPGCEPPQAYKVQVESMGRSISLYHVRIFQIS